MTQAKRFKKKWFLLGAACAGMVIFHQPLLLVGCKIALKKAIPSGEGRVVSYEQLEWENGSIVLSGLLVNDPSAELIVDRIELKFAGDFFKARFAPFVTIVHPQILLKSSAGGNASILGFLYRSRFFQPNWTVKNGVLQLPSSRFYFSMDPGGLEEMIGSLRFSYDPDPLLKPMFSAEIGAVQKGLQVGFKLQERDLERLIPLTALIRADIKPEWEKASGEVELEGQISFGPSFEIDELHFHGIAKEIALSSPKIGVILSCNELQGSFSFPEAEGQAFFWDKFSASVVLSRGECFLSEPLFEHTFGMKNLNGTLGFQPQKEPQLILNGTLLQEKRKVDFSLLGKGGVQENSTFWSELDFVLGSLRGNQMHSVFSLYSHDDASLALHAKVENAGFEHLDFLRAFAGLEGVCVEGVASGEAMLLYKNGWQSVAVENCTLDRMRWYFPHQEITVFSELIEGSCALSPGQKWTLDDLHLQMKGGDYLDPLMHVSALSADFVMDQGIIQSSSFAGEWEGLKTILTILGPEADHFADLNLSGDGKGLLSLIQPSSELLPLSMEIAAKIDGGVVTIEGSGTLAEEAVRGNASFALAPRTMLDLVLGNLPSFNFKEGKFFADKLTEKSYGRLVPMMSSDLKLSGNIGCEASFSPSRIQLKFLGEEIYLHHPNAQFYLPELKDRPAQFFYDVSLKQWRGEIPFAESELYYKNPDIAFTSIEGSMKLEEGHLKMPAFYAVCEGLALRGNLDINSNGQLCLSTSQVAGDVNSLLCVVSKFPSFSLPKIPLTGNFSCGEKGFVLRSSLGPDANEAEWNFSGNFNGLSIPVNATTWIRDGHCDIFFDSKTKQLNVQNAEGIWKLNSGMRFTVELGRLSAELTENCALDFALKLMDGKKNFAHLEGVANQTTSGWEIGVNSQTTHFGGMPLNISRCVLNKTLDITSFEMSPILKCKDLHAQASFLLDAGIFPSTLSADSLKEWKLEGTLQSKLFSKDMAKGFSFQLESKDLKVRGETLSSFSVRGQKIGDEWRIENLTAGALVFSGALGLDAEGISCPKFEGNWEGLSMRGSGFVKTGQKRFSCAFESIKGDLSVLKVDPKAAFLPKGTFLAGAALKGDFSDPNEGVKIEGEAKFFVDLLSPLPVIASSQRGVKFSYDKTKGFACTGVDLQLKHKISGAYLAQLQVETLSQRGTDFSLEQMQFSLMPAFLGHAIDAKVVPFWFKGIEWEGNFEGSGDLKVSKSLAVFQGNLSPGRYGFEGKSLSFEQLQLRYEKDIFSIRAKAQVEKEPLWASFQVDLEKEPYGMLKLFDHPKAEGLKIHFKTQHSKALLESIQGSCYGLSCSLAKSKLRSVSHATVLTGEIGLDVNAICPLLPKNMREGMQNLKVGSGYQWQGDLVLWNEAKKGFAVSGTLTGREFEALGYRLHRMDALIEANPERILVSNLRVEDPAGSIGIKKIELNKKEGWDLNIPQILIRQLRPSLMEKVDGERGELKPFMITNLTLSDIRGQLGNTDSLQGLAHLTFINQFKKESSILDAPLEMLKKLGLDLGILTPVQGEIQMELHGDKFYLISLDHAFSEGGRSEFYLAPQKNLSFIGLDGKMYIDLKMRQDVVLKITEPFTLTIRGTLDKPRYGLQF